MKSKIVEYLVMENEDWENYSENLDGSFYSVYGSLAKAKKEAKRMTKASPTYPRLVIKQVRQLIK